VITHNVNRLKHRVYDDEDILPSGLVIRSNWRLGQVGDWVKADDGCVIQILRRGTMHKPKGKNKAVEYVGTCTGTFMVKSTVKMDTSRRINIYSLGGNKKADDILLDREKLNKNEIIFATLLAKGFSLVDAYMKAFPTNNPGYAKVKAGQLIKTERVRTAMKEELKPVLEELNIDETFVLKNIKEVVLSSEKDDTRLKALFKLADIMDLEDKNSTKITQVTGALFQGFTPDQIEAVERPELEE
tara:strand:+ start:594 stop:1322 length:729 start_codon:yes stop_codon:yes gene_type:complete